MQVKFEGHSHYVMSIAFNPRDGGNTFATGSLDGTVRIWSIGSRTPNYSLDGHDKGVNAVDYYQAADKPYLCSVSDDTYVEPPQRACLFVGQFVYGITRTRVSFGSSMAILVR